MDGLALLCTLHADGPATLKRLRGAGCANLSALLERPITEVAIALDVAPASARRLLREARLLAERVGPELEAEEAPAPVAAASGPAPLTLELPPVTSASHLDRGDRALLERIVREGRPAAPDHAPDHVGVAREALDSLPGAAPLSPRARAIALGGAERGHHPGLAEAPSALERAGLDLNGEGPWPTAAPEEVEATPPSVEAVPDLTSLLTLEGVDEPLARALVRIGVTDVVELARTDALVLRRELQMTFAQAKRLSFLARRAGGTTGGSTARSGPPSEVAPRLSPAPLAHTPAAHTPAAHTPAPHTPVPHSPAPHSPAPHSPAAHTPAAHTPAAHTPAAHTPEPPRPAWRIEPRTAPLMLAPEPLGEPTVAPAPAVAPRPRFWEPRHAASADAAAGPGEPQGVLVDPSEVLRPRRFGDARRTAAQHAVGPPATGAQTAPPTGPVESERPNAGGTTLGWDFDVPRPERPPAPEPARAQRTWRPLEADDSSAGPFA